MNVLNNFANEIQDNGDTFTQENTQPSALDIRDALQKIRPHGLQNLVAIPASGGSPVGTTFDFPSQLDQAVVWAEGQNKAGMNVYFTVNPVNAAVGKKPTKAHIAGAEYAHVDIDPDLSAGYGAGREKLLQEKLPELKSFEPQPSLIIDSGNGLGVFWALDQVGAEVAEDINKRLIERFGGDVGTGNIDRLMRLPGTCNYPSPKKLEKGYPEKPTLARLLSASPGKIDIDVLVEALPEVAQPPRGQEPRLTAVSTSVRLSEARKASCNSRLNTALGRSRKLQERWNGSNAGLNDSSRSAMDFSVTALLKAEGFTFQEVSYLLTSRFEHGRGTENTERDLRRCWENSGGTPLAVTGVRAWVNDVFSAEEAAAEVQLDFAEVQGLDPYSILARGVEQGGGDVDREVEVVRIAHTKALQEINTTFAKTMIGGKVAIIREFVDPSMGTPTYSVMAPAQLKEWHRGFEAYKIKAGKIIPTNLGNDWLDWHEQRRYQTMTFLPGDAPPGVYNSWSGFPVVPEEGDWSLMKQLMLEGLCSGNQAYYDWLLDWMAAGIQHPCKRYGVAVVLRGEKGVGKGQFGKWYGKLFGNHFLHLSNAQHLVGNFNAHMEKGLLVFADELIWGGNKQQEGTLKALVTEDLIPIERKGWDTEMRKNYARLLVASNEDWAVPASTQERRWFVLDVSSKFRCDTEFFSALNEQMENGGVEAMMYDLANHPITSNQRLAPRTKALADIAQHGLDDVSAWMHEVLSGGMPIAYEQTGIDKTFERGLGFVKTQEEFERIQQAEQAPVGEETPEQKRGRLIEERQPSAWCQVPLCWPYAADKHSLYANFLYYTGKQRYAGKACGRETFFTKIGRLLPSVEYSRPRLQGKQRRVAFLPPLDNARDEFRRTTGLDFDFEYEDAA